jgi:CheY-like chemotaxis protein
MRTPVDVLIVDDVQENLLEVETLLRGDERNLILAETGEQALEALSENDVAAVVLDVHLPGISGFEVAERMRSDASTQHVPILFVTAIKQQPHHIRRPSSRTRSVRAAPRKSTRTSEAPAAIKRTGGAASAPS